jgi:hypothetical protein
MSVSDPGEKVSGERIANLEKMSECPALVMLRFVAVPPHPPMNIIFGPKTDVTPTKIKFSIFNALWKWMD